MFKKIYVSTDSEKIAKISKSLGAEVPFLRSKEISNDFTPLVPVVKDFLERLDIEIKNQNSLLLFALHTSIKLC